MAVWLGVDGGGTKTEALLVSDRAILGFSRGGPSNHQGVGLDSAARAVVETIQGALDQAGLSWDAVDGGAVLGLAGADFPEDIARLTEALTPHVSVMPFQVVNDAEIALSAGTPAGFGIAAIAGTGGNVFGRNRAGVKRQVGGLGYEWGDYGSGIDIAREVLHHAFRSAERRGPKTQLEPLVLEMLGMPDYEALSRAIYFREMPAMHFIVLAPLCFQAAAAGDAIAASILVRTGEAIAESVAGCARLLDMAQEPVDVVLAGSLWLGVAPHMKEAFAGLLAEQLPLARARVTDLRPVAGAALMAMEQGGEPTDVLRTVLRNDLRFGGVE